MGNLEGKQDLKSKCFSQFSCWGPLPTGVYCASERCFRWKPVFFSLEAFEVWFFWVPKFHDDVSWWLLLWFSPPPPRPPFVRTDTLQLKWSCSAKGNFFHIKYNLLPSILLCGFLLWNSSLLHTRSAARVLCFSFSFVEVCVCLQLVRLQILNLGLVMWNCFLCTTTWSDITNFV